MATSSLEKRISALEERLKPALPMDEILTHLAKQMRATCLSPGHADGGYIETPAELMQYREHFLYSTLEEYKAAFGTEVDHEGV